jgi:hypothetical protein
MAFIRIMRPDISVWKNKSGVDKLKENGGFVLLGRDAFLKHGSAARLPHREEYDVRSILPIIKPASFPDGVEMASASQQRPHHGEWRRGVRQQERLRTGMPDGDKWPCRGTVDVSFMSKKDEPSDRRRSLAEQLRRFEANHHEEKEYGRARS